MFECLWLFAGLFAYSCGSVVVLENLHTGSQRHWQGHTEEVSTLAVSNDALVGARDGDDQIRGIFFTSVLFPLLHFT